MDDPVPQMEFNVGDKSVDFSRALRFAKKWPDEWPTGELRKLDRFGYALIGRDSTRDSLTWDDLAALVTYYAIKANPEITPADINKLTNDQFMPMARVILEHFLPKMFPVPAEPESQDSPFPDGSVATPSPSPE